MKKILKVAALALMIPAISIAQQECIADSNGVCVLPGGGPGTGGGTGAQVWQGSWYDSSGTLHTVTASTFRACDTLLRNATSGMNVILGRCVRVS